MRERTGRNVIHPGERYTAYRIDSDTAGSLGFKALIYHLYGFSEQRQLKIVEHDAVDFSDFQYFDRRDSCCTHPGELPIFPENE